MSIPSNITIHHNYSHLGNSIIIYTDLTLNKTNYHKRPSTSSSTSPHSIHHYIKPDHFEDNILHLNLLQFINRRYLLFWLSRCVNHNIHHYCPNRFEHISCVATNTTNERNKSVFTQPERWWFMILINTIHAHHTQWNMARWEVLRHCSVLLLVCVVENAYDPGRGAGHSIAG